VKTVLWSEMTHVGFKYTITWSNPYRQPPDGQPRTKHVLYETLAQREERRRQGDTSTPPKWFNDLHTIGDGYCISITAICTPTRQISAEALASVRRMRLERRMRKKYPLFADQMIQEELAAKPDFYAGITDPAIAARYRSAIEDEQRWYDEFLAATTKRKLQN
jgi:hypothetical protein